MSLSFLVDGMLGSLNRWLRICGYETEFYRDASDEKLLEISKEKGHIVLTRDRNLSREARRSGVEAFIVLGKNIEEMLVSVAKEFGLILNPVMARCTTCGSMLNEVPKHNVDGEVPPSSYAVYKKYWRCMSCGKVFWRGSHWKKIPSSLSRSLTRRKCSRVYMKPASDCQGKYRSPMIRS